MNRIFQISQHALGRMTSRNVSKTQVAQAIFCGQVFASGDGTHHAKIWEEHGKTVDEYVVVFSKKSNRIITVEHNILRARKHDEEIVSKHLIRKIYKQRKRAICEQEFNSWCREEYNQYNLSFTA